MNDQKENKLGMLLEVKAHLEEYDGTYTTITGYPMLKAEFFTAIETIFTLNGIIETDITGSAAAKAQKRNILIEAFTTVHRGLAGYAAVNEDEELLHIIDYTVSEIARMRDAELFTNAAQIVRVINDIDNWPALIPFHLTSVEVDALTAASDVYLGLLSRPGVVEAHRTTALNKLERVFDRVDYLLKNKLDFMSASLAATFPDIHAIYMEVRKIDDTGPSTPATHTGTANPGVSLIASYAYNANRSFRFKNHGPDMVHFGLGVDSLTLLPPGIIVASGNQNTRLSSNLAASGDNLLVENTSPGPVEYSIWVIEP